MLSDSVLSVQITSNTSGTQPASRGGPKWFISSILLCIIKMEDLHLSASIMSYKYRPRQNDASSRFLLKLLSAAACLPAMEVVWHIFFHKNKVSFLTLHQILCTLGLTTLLSWLNNSATIKASDREVFFMKAIEQTGIKKKIFSSSSRTFAGISWQCNN